MGVSQRRSVVPDVETQKKKVPFKDLASIVGHKDGENLNYTFEFRQDAEGGNVYVKKRAGYGITSSLSAASTATGAGICSWRKSSETADRLIAAIDDGSAIDIYIDSSGTLVKQQKSGPADLDLTTGAEVTFVPISAWDGSTKTEELWVFTGSDAVVKYNGSSWSVSSAGEPLSGTVGKYAAFHNNMLFVSRQNRLYISDVGAPETFTAGNELDFPGEITGIAPFRSFLVVFTRDTITLVQGFSPSTIVTSSQNRGLAPKYATVGCDAQKTIRPVGDWLYFWNKDRFYRTNTTEIQEVAFPKIEGTLSTVVKTQASSFYAEEWRGRYYCAVVYSTGTGNNRVLVYDPNVDEWTVHSSPPIAAMTKYRESEDDAPGLYFVTNNATSRTAKVFQYNKNQSPLDYLAVGALNGAITDFDDTITLSDASEFPTSGTGLVGSEIITWTGKSSNDLTGCTRGSNDTLATSHLDTTDFILLDGTITMQYTTEDLDFGDQHYLKKYKHLFYNTIGIGATAVAKMQVSQDYDDHTTVKQFVMDSGGFVLGTNVLGDALGSGDLSQTTVTKLNLPASRTLSFRFKDTQGAGRTEFYDFDIEIIPKKLKTR